MVKGVNKTIIEINNTGSKYFDRVLLFVNPAHSHTPHSRLENEAAEIIRIAGEGKSPVVVPHKKRRKRKRGLFFLFLAAAVALLHIILL